MHLDRVDPDRRRSNSGEAEDVVSNDDFWRIEDRLSTP